MKKLPVIAIFDAGKTNKKLFLFDEQYKIVFERTWQFDETTDDDGDPCENIDTLTSAVEDGLSQVLSDDEFDVKAINFTSYGASFVHLDQDRKPVTPIYNYLKPYPQDIHQKFYSTYGGEEKFSLETASPVLGSLNSGMQLYRIKYEKPRLYDRIHSSLHLPQFLSSLVSGKQVSEITSIGCHTNLWNYHKNSYHEWVVKEGINEKLPAIVRSDSVFSEEFFSKKVKTGIGLHDSSAALIPYLATVEEPFILLSTGTWCISMNPFNDSPLTASELQQDCLCYLTYEGKPVKASRLFAGNEHEIQTKKLAAHFHVDSMYYKTVSFSEKLIQDILEITPQNESLRSNDPSLLSRFNKRDLTIYKSYELAYHQLMLDIMRSQVASTRLVASKGVSTIFVDGGFSKNQIYMNLLATAFPENKVYAASVPEATAMGAALAIHTHWNRQPVSKSLIQLQAYRPDTNIHITEVLYQTF